MTTNYNESANTFTGDVKLYSSEILQLFAGKKIVSATPCSELTAKNGKKYPGIIVQVEDIALKVGFLPWEIRTFTVQHYVAENQPIPAPVDSPLKDAVMSALLSCKGNEEAYYKAICNSIEGKYSGYHQSTGKNAKTGKTYTNLTWIVVESADKAIVDITKVEEKKED
jgi:hypothetical protein